MTGDSLFGDVVRLEEGTELTDTRTGTPLTVTDITFDGGQPHQGHVTVVTDDNDVRIIEWPSGFDGRYRAE